MNRTHDTPAARSTPPVGQRPDRACAGVDPEIFFPSDRRKPLEALDLCGICPHTQDCLDWALDTGQTHGIWGGKTAEERYQLSKNREAS